jgi:nucleotide-binding universal stress UspA family protein
VIVVGFDGSEGAEHALRWAGSEAAIRNTDLHVLYGWHIPQVVSLAFGERGWTGFVPPMEELQRTAQHHVERQVAAVLPPEQAARARCDARNEHPVRLLVSASTGAELLVVGSRGHSPARSLVLGSVSLACVHQAHCPVVVVRS